MRELTSEELVTVAGGVGPTTLTFNFPALPKVEFSIIGNQGSVTFGGMTLPIGVGQPNIVIQ